jgi:three-Cys-motif partner protein
MVEWHKSSPADQETHGMTVQQQFGGDWTQDKLARLKGYLEAYMVIFRRHPYLLPVYVDAFAGTGRISPKTPGPQSEDIDPDATALLKGSARIALEVEPPFHRYIFVEQSARKSRELESLRTEYVTRAGRIQIETADATTFLTDWCSATDWSKTRAVVFLDPFGMQIEWSLLERLAETEAIDLWLLVPLGMGVNRMTPKDSLPPPEWADKLTRFFGTNEWRNEFYRPRLQPDLFGESSPVEKNVNFQGLADYFVNRLKEVFPGVADNPLTQRNSRSSPMFLLCFATANPKPSIKKAALDIAGYLLKEH